MANILESAVAFSTLLTTCVVSVRSRQRIIDDEGIDTLNGLCSLTKSELNDMVSGINKAYKTISRAQDRCSIGTLSLKRLHAIRSWAKDALIEGQKEMFDDPFTLAALDAAWLVDIGRIYLSNESEETDTSQDIVKVEFDGTNWYDARRSILDIVASRKGAKGISLGYLTRIDNGNWDDHYETLEQRRIATYRHSGPGFDEDNKAFYQLLVQYFSKTSCNDVVRHYERSKNGTAAWNAVKNHNEGGGFKQQLIQEANEQITKAKFTGNAKFGFEDYFKIHVRCHLMLAEAGQPMGEFQKITTFMSNVTDPGIKQDYKTIRSNQDIIRSFQALFNHLYEGHRIDHPEGIPNKNTYPPNSRKRNIAQVQRGGGRGGRGGRGRHGRGGRGRGGRGRGSNNNSNSTLPAAIRENPHASISSDTWNNLSYSQRNAVHALRDNMPKPNDNGRNVNSLETDNSHAPDMSQANGEKTSQASNAFGSRPRGKNN